MFKTKYRRILAFAAALIILFVFLIVPASASSISNNTNNFISAPVPLLFGYTFYDSSQSEIDLMYPSVGYLYSPVLAPSYYRSDPNAIHYIEDNSRIVSDFRFSISTFTVPLQSSDNLYGVFTYGLNGPSFGSSFGSSLPLTDFTITLNDFFCWNHNFNTPYVEGLPVLGSECDLTFENQVSSDLAIEFYSVEYVKYGTDSVNTIVVYPTDESPAGEDLGNNIINVRPSYFGDSEDSIYYIKSLVIHFTGLPNAPTLNNGYDPYFDIKYVVNPFLDSLVYSGVNPDSPSDNPALALIPYTTWLGEAVSGFMDFELFNGFTLGGIFMTILAFTCVMWFLKLVAGG